MLALPTDNAGRTRLLPASVPYRYFVAAALFHLTGWALLAGSASHLESVTGGLAPAVAALHAFTVGTLAMTVVGASLQLLPVATVQSVLSVRVSAALAWVLVPATAGLVAGLALQRLALASVSALALAASFTVYGTLLAANLARARRRRAMTGFAWFALAALAATVVLGPLVVFNYRWGVLPGTRSFALAHLVLAAYGFVGLLAVGFSYLLVPMFMVTRAPPEPVQWRVLVAAGAAIGLAVILLAAGSGRPALVVPILGGLAVASVHARHMFALTARRRSREAPWSLALLRAGWVMLPSSLALAALLALGLGPPRLGPLFVVVLVAGWLLTFVLAILMRIVPFLASVHVRVAGGRLPLVSTLTPARGGWLFAGLHLTAVALLVAGLALGSPPMAQAGAVCGAAGAAAFVGFLAGVGWRARAMARAPGPGARKRS